MPFEFKKLEIDGVVLIKPKVFEDNRGFFLESYKKSDFENFGIKDVFVQDNHSKSVKSVIRGLHFQKHPYEQSKLVRCISGKIFDVAVDLRKNSPTYKKWVGIELSDENNFILYIPKGFAHGFCVLSDEAHVVYKCDCEYMPFYDAGIRWDDPDINIKWPITDPLVSDKDKNLPYLREVYL